MGKHQYRKEVRELVAFAEKLGFVDHGLRGSGHILLKHPNGTVTLAATPSRPSSTRNSLSDIKAVAAGRYLK
jgi:predicted RNA binding protein YcfA (HicA-like mRNA interferase family)